MVLQSSFSTTQAFSSVVPRTNPGRQSTWTTGSANILGHDQSRHLPGRRDQVRLYSGSGVARGYTWKEEAFEIDVTVKVPKETRAKDVQFCATSKSIDLQLVQPNGTTRVLLDGNRTLRGRVSLDGTYWIIDDVTQDADMMNLALPYREVTVTVEKWIRTPSDDFETCQYDWHGLFLDDDDEVVSRTYDKPEELDVKEYAASLGVDIDNLNMSMVDKSLFSSDLNATQAKFEELTKAGLLKEVVETQQQQDLSMPFATEDPQPQPFQTSSSFDETSNENGPEAAASKEPAQPIPFLDTNSPWHTTTTTDQKGAAVSSATEGKGNDAEDEQDEEDENVVKQTRYFTRAAFAQDAAASKSQDDDEEEDDEEDEDNQNESSPSSGDPIDLLTVKKLKEILRSQGLKVSGNKKELQERLRQQVNALLQGGSAASGNQGNEAPSS